MSNQSGNEVTQILQAMESGDNEAQQRLLSLTYGELRDIAHGLMRHESAGHTLQPTALLHEAVLRFFRKDEPGAIPNRAYFFGAMARAMRQVLVDHARKRDAQKRGVDRERIPLDETLQCVERASGCDLLALDELLDRLESLDPRASEVVMLRCFAGQEIKEIAGQMGVSASTIDREWRFARAWLRKELTA